ncbi:apolipoprotein(a)-like isoform X12 [Rhopilema esculentum]|uniref:apolipoprotein(a)-like isoform X12 n=1 Tax=Rhopilema esculentum TaxID=499914 RepID=UPI0031CEE47F
MSCIGKSVLVKLKHMILCAGLMSLYFSLIFVVMIVNEWKITKRTSDVDIEDPSLRNWDLCAHNQRIGAVISTKVTTPVTEPFHTVTTPDTPESHLSTTITTPVTESFNTVTTPDTPESHLSTTKIKTGGLTKAKTTTTTAAVTFTNSTSLFGGNATTPNATPFARLSNRTANFTASVTTTAATNNTIAATTKEAVMTTKQATTRATTTTALATTERQTTTQLTETISTTKFVEATTKAATTTQKTTKETTLKTTTTAPTTTAIPTNSTVQSTTAGPHDCKTTVKGMGYRGYISQTRTGKDCQRWDQQYPHTHRLSPTKYPTLGLDSNYCRNPDGEPFGPWCYSLDPAVRWEYCQVPMCS